MSLNEKGQSIPSDPGDQKTLQADSEFHFRNLFENSPISLWNEDFSRVKEYIDEVRSSGITDFRAYFDENPQELKKCAGLIRVVDVNQTTLKLFKAAGKEQLIHLDIPNIGNIEFPTFRLVQEELLAFIDGKTEFVGESQQMTLERDELSILAHLVISPGHEKTWDEVFYSVIDITRQKRVEEALRESQARNAAFLNALPDLMFICDRQGVLLDFHAADHKKLLLPPEAFLGQRLRDVMPPESAKMMDDYLLRVFTSREMQILEYPIMLPDELEYYEARGIQYGNEKALIIIRDITARKQSEEALQRREMILSAVNFTAEKMLTSANWVASMPDVLEHLSQATQSSQVVIFKNLKDEAGSPYTRCAFEWHEPTETVNGGDECNTTACFQESFPEWVGQLNQNQVIHINLHQTNVVGLVALKPALVAPILVGGEVWGFVGLDVYQQKRIWSDLEIEALKTAASILGAAIQRQQSDDARRKSEERYRILVEVSPDAVIYTNMEGIILFANPLTAEFYQKESHSEIVGQNLLDLIESQQRSQVHKDLASLYMSGVMQEKEYSLIGKDGKNQLAGVRVAVARDEQGNPSGLIWVLRDIEERKQMEGKIIQSNIELKRTVAELERYNREATLRNEMGNLLESCLTVEEAYAVVAQFAEELFDHQPGALLRLSESRNLLEMVVTWGSPMLPDVVFPPEQCWAMRRGRTHVVNAQNQRLRCDHAISPGGSQTIQTICVPLVAQGMTFGVLHQHVLPEKSVEQAEPVIQVFAERIALSLANLRLSETLRMQSVRDPLTNLFNRRYMEETLEREIHRAQRHQRPMGLLMLDLDNFKIFNDTHGHAAGDALLKALGAYLLAHIRAGDVACRYGGDEFAIVMPEASLKEAQQRAEQIRLGIKNLQVDYQHTILADVTASIGVTSFPEQGKNVEEILRIADNALFRVKKHGRDRVFLAEG